MRLRVLVYNVKGFRFGVDRVAAVVGEHEPDVAMLNECGTGRKLDRTQAWPGRTKLAFLFLNVLLENLFQKWNIPELGLAGLS